MVRNGGKPMKTLIGLLALVGAAVLLLLGAMAVVRLLLGPRGRNGR